MVGANGSAGRVIQVGLRPPVNELCRSAYQPVCASYKETGICSRQVELFSRPQTSYWLDPDVHLRSTLSTRVRLITHRNMTFPTGAHQLGYKSPLWDGSVDLVLM